MEEKKEMTEAEAIEFFSEFYGGEHHIPGYKPKNCGFGWSVNHDRGDLATFDYNQLTRLVLMGHDQCVRVSVEAVRQGIIRISIWKRKREGAIFDRHPTIEHAIEKYNSLKDSSRKDVENLAPSYIHFQAKKKLSNGYCHRD